MSKKGYKQTEEHKINARNARVYKPLSDETKRKISIKTKEVMATIPREKLSFWKGKKMSIETRKKMCLSAKKGKYNWKWISDRTKLSMVGKTRNSSRHRDWSLSVKKRDHWKCRINNCDCSGKVVAHHILSWKDYEELRFDINNGITLCKFHHPLKREEERKSIPKFKKIIESLIG